MPTAELGWIVPEEVVDQALRLGVEQVRDAFADNTSEELFSRIYFNLSAPQRAAITEWWSQNDPRIIHAWPRDETQIPCLAIVIDPEELSGQYLADAGYQKILSDGSHAIVRTERWRVNVGVVIHAENADLARWLYQWAKWVLARGRLELSRIFQHAQTLAGRDLQFDPRFMQAGRFVYRRALSFTGEFDQSDISREEISDTLTGDLQVVTVEQWV